MIAPTTEPSPAELEALIKEARARQLRRRLLGAAGVAIGAALGLSVYAFVIGGNPGNLAQPPASGGRATGPRCRASQLSTTLGFQGATQTILGGADIENTSGASCSLPSSWPRVRLWAGGKRLAVVQRRPAGYRHFTAKPVHVLVPGQQATIEMQWANWCGTPREPASVRFAIRLGPGLVLHASNPGSPRCIGPGHPSTLLVDRPRQRS